jgi:amidase
MSQDLGPLWRLGASELASAIRARRLTSEEVVQAHLERIEAVNPEVGAITVVLRDEALAAAREADRAVAAGRSLEPLHGVPFTVKENIDLAGSATTVGLKALKEACPKSDAPLTAQLRRAGAIPLARTNLPDLGLRWHTDNELRGATRNPWDPTRTPGGSSGGEAAALATGMTPLGVGNDYGGSLRWPSQCCGTVAVKPTTGRVPRHFSFLPQEGGITTQLYAVDGPMARHVRDLRVALANMCAADPRDPWWTPAPLEGAQTGEPVRVAVSADPGSLGVNEDVSAAVRNAADALADAGYAVEEVELPGIEEGLRLWAQSVTAEVRTDLLPLMKKLAGRDAILFMEQLLDNVPDGGLPQYVRALADRNRLAREWTQFFTHHPLVLGPVCTEPPFAVGQDVAGSAEVGSILRSMRLVVTVNLLGLPAVALPTGVAGGLPQGVQLIATRFREDLCLNAAEAIERAYGVLTPIDPKTAPAGLR